MTVNLEELETRVYIIAGVFAGISAILLLLSCVTIGLFASLRSKYTELLNSMHNNQNYNVGQPAPMTMQGNQDARPNFYRHTSQRDDPNINYNAPHRASLRAGNLQQLNHENLMNLELKNQFIQRQLDADADRHSRNQFAGDFNRNPMHHPRPASQNSDGNKPFPLLQRAGNPGTSFNNNAQRVGY